MNEYENIDPSTYNTANLDTMRLETLRQNFEAYITNDQLDKARTTLETIKARLSYDMEKFGKVIMTLKSGKEITDLTAEYVTWFNKLNGLARRKPGDYKEGLLLYSEFLRKVQEISGKGSKYKNSDEERIRR